MSAINVFKPKRFRRLIVADALNVSRDPMLLFATAMAILPTLALWAFIPAIDAAAFAAFGIEHFSRFLLPVALMLPATLIGWVTGFLLLEDRDDGLLPVLDVTPVGKAGLLAYRTTITALIASAISIFALAVLGAGLDVWQCSLIVLLVAANAVVCSVILPVLARNRVEGLALTKVTNIMAIVPLLAAIPSPFRLLAGVVPSYWIGEALLPRATASPLPS